MRVKCEVWRSDGGGGVKGRYDSFVFDVDPTETVLGILVKINHDFDSTLAFRFACGVVKCGECAVEVNGTPCLACKKMVEEEMKIRPLPELPLIRDLVIDRRAVFDQIMKLIPQVSQVKIGCRAQGPQPGRYRQIRAADEMLRVPDVSVGLPCPRGCEGKVRRAARPSVARPIGPGSGQESSHQQRHRCCIGNVRALRNLLRRLPLFGGYYPSRYWHPCTARVRNGTKKTRAGRRES